jgi:hypothetical protein
MATEHAISNFTGETIWTARRSRSAVATASALTSSSPSKLLADRGWGRSAVYQPQEGDPLDLASTEQAAEWFRAEIIRLTPEADPT